jgi:hypothetical protein
MNTALVNSIRPCHNCSFFGFAVKGENFIHRTRTYHILFGVLLVLTKGHLLDIFQLNYNKGDLLMILAILVWTFYSIIGKKLKNIPIISATAVSVFLGLILVAPLAIARE